MKNVIRLTESDLHNIITDTCRLVLERWETVNGYPSQEMDAAPPKEFVLQAYKLVRFNPNSKDRVVYPLFVNTDGENAEKWEIGKWYKAGIGTHQIEIDDQTNQPTGKVKVNSSLGGLSFRPGLHFGTEPYAPHIYSKKPNFKDDDIDGWGFETDANGERKKVFGKTHDWFQNLSDKEKKKVKGSWDYSNTRAMKENTCWALCEIAYSESDQTEATNNGNYMKKGKVVNNARNSMLRKLPQYGYKYKTNSNAPDNQTWYISNMMRVVKILSDEEVKQRLAKSNIKMLDRTEMIDLSHLY